MAGERPTRVLLIHGFASSFEHGWRESGWVDILGDYGVSVPAIDLPGHGRWSPLRDPEAYLDVPESLFASLPPRPPYVAVGFSAGAQTLLRMAVAHPDAFERIVLMGLGDSVFDDVPTSDLAGLLLGDEDTDDVQQRLFRRLAMTTGSDLESLRCFISRPQAPLRVDEVASVRCPVLVVLGERDEASAERLVAALPDVRFVSLKGVDHFSTPQEFGAIDATMRFLGLD
jgi:pimeloyl-ACP methyl ester carboxylesterase